MASKPRLFCLYRREDETGVSGTGVVAYGVQWPDGRVTIQWLGEYSSVVLWNSIDHVVHVHGHNGLTQIIWDDQ